MALEIRHDRKYAGSMCRLGDEIDIKGTKVKTFPTEHTVGASAFYWENDVGTRILVTGDVKDASSLPPVMSLSLKLTTATLLTPPAILQMTLRA